MKKILLWVWQLPQNLIGFVYVNLFAKALYIFDKDIWVWFAPCFKAGVTFGEYIILDPIYKNAFPEQLAITIKHEYGHVKQSRILGWFYLFIVGIPSVIRNILNRINPVKFNLKWYYSGLPEKWADKIGGVGARW